MTQVVDGVRRSRQVADARPAQPVVRVVSRPVEAVLEPEARPRPLKYSAVAARLPQGRLDGVRRQPAARAASPVAAGHSRPLRPVTEPTPRPIADIRRLASIGSWRRPAIGFAMAALAFVSAGLASRSITPPTASTARAEQALATTAPTAPRLTDSAPNSLALQQILDGFAVKNPGLFSIYVKNLKTGETATVAPDTQMTSASLYKLFVAQRTLAQVDLGQWQLSDGAGSGTGRTIDGCLNVMISVSDNGCGRALGTKLGWGKQNPALSVEGYHDTDLASPQKTSARDVAALFEKLYRGTLLSARSSDEFMSLLTSQRVNNRLPQGLPAGTVFAHKTGDLDGYVHDAGIVYGPKSDYLVVVMSGAWKTPGAAPSLFGDLSGQLWNYFEQ